MRAGSSQAVRFRVGPYTTGRTVVPGMTRVGEPPPGTRPGSPFFLPCATLSSASVSPPVEAWTSPTGHCGVPRWCGLGRYSPGLARSPRPRKLRLAGLFLCPRVPGPAGSPAAGGFRPARAAKPLPGLCFPSQRNHSAVAGPPRIKPTNWNDYAFSRPQGSRGQTSDLNPDQPPGSFPPALKALETIEPGRRGGRRGELAPHLYSLPAKTEYEMAQ